MGMARTAAQAPLSIQAGVAVGQVQPDVLQLSVAKQVPGCSWGGVGRGRASCQSAPKLP